MIDNGAGDLLWSDSMPESKEDMHTTDAAVVGNGADEHGPRWLTFFDLPWFIRYRILELAIQSSKIGGGEEGKTENGDRDAQKQVRLWVRPMHDVSNGYLIQGTERVPFYHTLRLVSRDVSSESRIALLKTCTVVIKDRDELEQIQTLLTTGEVTAIRSLLVDIEHQPGHHHLYPAEREFACLTLTCKTLQDVCPQLHTLELKVDPGSDKFHHQLPFEFLLYKHDRDEETEPFGNAWGTMAAKDELVGRTVEVMGDKLVAWMKEMITQARQTPIEVWVSIHFRTAADPRLGLEEKFGRMSTKDWELVVEHHILDYVVPQTLKFDDLT